MNGMMRRFDRRPELPLTFSHSQRQRLLVGTLGYRSELFLLHFETIPKNVLRVLGLTSAEEFAAANMKIDYDRIYGGDSFGYIGYIYNWQEPWVETIWTRNGRII